MTEHPFGLKVNTSIPVATFEDWLAVNCRGDCTVSVIDISDDLSKKTLGVFFQYEADRDVFRQGYPSIK